MNKLIVSLILLTSQLSFAQIKLKEIHKGLDWYLPKSAKMADDAGYLSLQPEWNLKKAKSGHLIDGKLRYATIIMPTWAELEPFPGKYNWQLLDDAINAASRQIDAFCGRYFYADGSASARKFFTDDLYRLKVDDISTTTGLVVKYDDDDDGNDGDDD